MLEYTADELADDSDDEKRLEKAERTEEKRVSKSDNDLTEDPLIPAMFVPEVTSLPVQSVARATSIDSVPKDIFSLLAMLRSVMLPSVLLIMHYAVSRLVSASFLHDHRRLGIFLTPNNFSSKNCTLRVTPVVHLLNVYTSKPTIYLIQKSPSLRQ